MAILNNILSHISSLLTKLHTLYLKKHYNIIGNGSYVYYRSRVINRIKGGVQIGEGSTIGRTRNGYHAGMPFFTTLLNDGENSHITIGNHCRINGAYIHAKEFIEIGDYCVMASGITIIDSNAHNVNSINRTIGQDIPEGIRIGNNVWIGLNAVILKGTVIGDNCVVAAGSIVKGEYPDNIIIQGNPAKCVGEIHLK